MKIKDAAIAGVVLLVVLLIILPIPPAMLDVFLVMNISTSLLVLLMTLYVHEPLDFAAFPTLLLFLTLFRLGLNIASTRLILGNDGNAGNVIEAFGSFATGGNIVVGIIIFVIIIVIQFVVITKGAERVAEVSARFTLDAMPGKQMAIDADLNSGLINEQQARERREKISSEADFYGAMDGSSKFVKGDAIVGILITVINIVGGLIIGSMYGAGMPFDEILQIYTIATIGDGLVSQIPALMVSTATGIIVTRAASKENFGRDLINQLTSQPYVFLILGIMLIVISLIPGLPKVPIYIIAALILIVGIVLLRANKKPEKPTIEEDKALAAAKEKRKPENVTSLLQVELIGIELGYGLVPLVDTTQGGDLLERVVMIRRQCAIDLGIIVPVIRIRDNIQLGTNEYVIKIKGIEVAKGEVMLDHVLALSTNEVKGKIQGIETVEPTFGLPAVWITENEREKAELLGYTTVDAPSVIATHLTETIKRHASELLTRQQVQTLVDNLKTTQPALVEETVPKLFSLGELQKVLGNLLEENIPIRDMGSILETLADYGTAVRDTDLLTEYVRKSLCRAISKRFVPDGNARVITLDPSLENLIAEKTKQTEQGTYVALSQDEIQRIYSHLRTAVEKMNQMGITPIVLTSPLVRRQFKNITHSLVPDLIVLSYNELENNVEVYSDGVIGL
ncbi:flagellar biosynthesis protein FlhA [Christensenella intestinihominis]|uniref:flagellar biosynthesis protein FlhA n=1 Tax=Christensenella intestinihominis TaxID=1851429 RepID=UPI00082AD526|nr:flagellar biosynthesis protein FlhA [Christensenella intestinihominis]